MKTNKNSVKMNFLYNLFYQFLLMAAPLITAPYVSRVLGANGIGIYSYTYSITTYFALFAMLGINTYGSREIAACRNDKNKLNQTFSEIYTLQILLSGISLFAYFFFLVFFVKSNLNIFYIQTLYLLSAVLDVNWLFFGLEEFRITVIRKSVIKLLTVFCIFGFVDGRESLVIYTIILSFGFFLGQSFLWIFVNKFVKFKIASFKSLMHHLKPVVLLFLPLVAVSVYRIINKIVLGYLGTMNDVGQFENAEKIIMVALGAVSALGTVMLPKMASLIAEGEIKVSNKYLEKSMQFVMFMTAAVSFGIAGIAENFAPLFFGPDFKGCGIILSYMSISIIFIAWANVIRTQYLIPRGKEKEYVSAVWLGAAIDIVLVLLLIPTIGIIGAVLAAIAAEIFVAVYQTYCSRKDLDYILYIKQSLFFLFSGFIMFFVVRLVPSVFTMDALLILIIQIVAGILVYLSMTFSYFIMTDNKVIWPIIFSLLKKAYNLIR